MDNVGQPDNPTTPSTPKRYGRGYAGHEAAPLTDEALEALATLLGKAEAVDDLLDDLYARMSPGSVQLVVRTLRALGEWGSSTGLVRRVYLDGDDTFHGNPQKPVLVYTEDETATLIGAAKGVSLRWWAYLYTVAETGRRASETLALEWQWLNLGAAPPHYVLPMTKARKAQYCPLSSKLVEVVFTDNNMTFLASRRDGGRYQGDPTVRPFPWHYQTVYNMFRRLCRVTGVPHRGLHCFRHSLATRLLAKGTPPHAVAALLGNTERVLMRTYDQTLSLHYASYLE